MNNRKRILMTKSIINIYTLNKLFLLILISKYEIILVFKG